MSDDSRIIRTSRNPLQKDSDLIARSEVKARIEAEGNTRRAAIKTLIDGMNDQVAAMKVFGEALQVMSDRANDLTMALVQLQTRLDEHEARTLSARARRAWRKVRDYFDRLVGRLLESNTPPVTPVLMVPPEAQAIVIESYPRPTLVKDEVLHEESAGKVPL